MHPDSDDTAPAREMPRYKCHKQVRALKIAGISSLPAGGATIYPADAGYTGFEVDQGYVEKHHPQPGGYYVIYDDGYKSFSPAKAFEEGYTRISPVTEDGRPWKAA